MFLRKTHVSPPPPARSSVRAVEGRQRTRYGRFETEAFIKVRRTCTYIYKHQKGLLSYEVWRLWVKGYMRYWAETVFTLRITVTFTFDLLTLKSVGVFYEIRAITLWSLKALDQRVLELLSGNGFHSSGHCDLYLWPTDPKISRGLLRNQGYHPMKFEGSGSKGTRVIERKRFSLFGSLWSWPFTYWPQNH